MKPWNFQSSQMTTLFLTAAFRVRPWWSRSLRGSLVEIGRVCRRERQHACQENACGLVQQYRRRDRRFIALKIQQATGPEYRTRVAVRL
jgi:hypothetical protein